MRMTAGEVTHAEPAAPRPAADARLLRDSVPVAGGGERVELAL
jgi:hypothetical protein